MGADRALRNTFLPVQITSQDVPLLAGPMSLIVTAGGKPLVFRNLTTKSLSRRDDQVVLETHGAAGDLEYAGRPALSSSTG